MDKMSEIKFKELEKEINRSAKEEDIKFIHFPLEISKIRTRLLLLSSITIIGIYFDININPKALGFEFNDTENQNFPIMLFFLISIIYLLIYFMWNIIDYIGEHKIRNISKRAFGSIYGEDAEPVDSLTTAVNSFIEYLTEFLRKQNVSDTTKHNFKVSYKRMGIYTRGLSIFNKSQLLRFYFIEVGLPFVLSVVALIMIVMNLLH